MVAEDVEAGLLRALRPLQSLVQTQQPSKEGQWLGPLDTWRIAVGRQAPGHDLVALKDCVYTVAHRIYQLAIPVHSYELSSLVLRIDIGKEVRLVPRLEVLHAREALILARVSGRKGL